MKTILRKKIQNDRLSLSSEAVTIKSNQIASQLFSTLAYKNAQTLLLYMDFRNEVQTSTIIHHCLMHQKAIVLPVVSLDKKKLLLVQINSLEEDLVLSAYGIYEPIVHLDRLKTIEDIDLILTPGVAFDSRGNRLGYGAGYYDKLLEKRPSKLITYGLAFDLQIVDDLPHDAYDQPVNAIITESRIILCNASTRDTLHLSL